MAEKYTKSQLERNNYIFYPKSSDESRTLQEELINMGITWGDGDTNVSEVDKTLKGGLIILNGKMYTRNKNDERDYITLPVSSVIPELASQDSRYLREQFAKLNDRLDQMEKQISEIREAVLPDTLDKPVLKKPGGGAKVTP